VFFRLKIISIPRIDGSDIKNKKIIFEGHIDPQIILKSLKSNNKTLGVSRS